jgi:hypothetical protein
MQRAGATAAAEERRLVTQRELRSQPSERLALRPRRLVLPLFGPLSQALWLRPAGRRGAILLDAPSSVS